MYILIPLLLILFSIAGVIVILVRKFPQLEKLGPDIKPTSQNILYDLFPEAIRLSQRLNLKGSFHTLLAELEKVLRKMRLALMATERISDRIIHRIRRAQKQQTAQDTIIASQPFVAPVAEVHTEQKELISQSEEQRLILAIAQDPKNFVLYAALGKVYTKMGNWNDAKESLQAALKLKPDDRELAQKLSQVLEKILQK